MSRRSSRPAGANLLRLSARGLLRDLRASDVRALFVALALAVAASTMIGFFLDRLDRGLTRQAGQLLGGDLVLEQGRPFDDALRRSLKEAGMTLSDQVDLVTMVSLGDAFQPASLKAVDGVYPHYGQLHVDRGAGIDTVDHGPAPGEAWLAPRLALLLEAELGDRIQVGEGELTVTGLVEREPDQSAGFGSFNPRLMVHVDDLDATNLVQPGARVEFELLAAGPPQALERLAPLLERLRRDGVEVRDVRRDRPGLGNALERAEKYLSLAGLAAVLLAGVAVAMATRRYVERHLDTAALLRCFGATQRDLTWLFALQLLWLALAASVLGALLGLAGQAVLLALLTTFLPLSLPPPGWLPLWLGVLTALAVLVGFAGPTLLRLKRVSALKVLRRELDPLPAAAWLVVLVASLVFGGLLWLYSGDFGLAAALLLGGLVMLVVLWGLGSLLLGLVLRLADRLPQGGGQGELSQAVRLGGRQLARRRAASLGQLLAFAVTFFAMAMIALVRGDLLSTWQAQLPEDTPNYFAINIQPGEREAFVDALEANADDRTALYPMVRGRLTAINGEPAREAVPVESRGDGSLRRELNLTWQAELPEGNRVVAGRWFDELESAPAGDGWLGAVDAEPREVTVPISLEDGLAERLGLALGDRMTFTIGGEEIVGEVASLRNLDWDSFRPNFFVIFPPGVLERFGHSFITAFHLEAGQGETLRRLVQGFPGVSLLNIDAILAQVREVVTQVTRAVELVLAFVLLAGVSVLYAALTASRPARAHESGLLRVFGAGGGLISRVQGAEFAILGLASGLMGALLAELATAGIYVAWLDLAPRLHPWLWLVLPLGGALLIGAIGHALSRGLRRQAPAASLGLLGEA
ncbi:FtsX-like permease family protein [Halomonas sp. MCCC 1A17488]|uniref:ABC transporter permease n=1 Tax=unclassified Halomonas TaxID=2609666 RepID=UPI0018D254D8|nr:MULTISPECIES: FtsX-like permease family protein [unclassified Halomonas]MCE8018109.1 FtsX-like permease family protein [Halomonas sp. MCCC 1A17488]MCG3241442.1 FtsX-like permease family protein [Halomonas sp. MCCC 1A17488]QPP48598.1 FtsX-like permease family protein [Halomonas sp. SS10-MC5]